MAGSIRSPSTFSASIHRFAASFVDNLEPLYAASTSRPGVYLTPLDVEGARTANCPHSRHHMIDAIKNLSQELFLSPCGLSNAIRHHRSMYVSRSAVMKQV